jgi:DNA-directed RNA polymerase specialized sigma24 family protein
MVDSVPTLTDMLQGLENSPPPPQTSEEKSKRKYQGLTDAEKLAQAVSWQQQGIPVSAIAKIFEVTPRTIHKWLSKAKAEFRETFEGETAADNLAGHLMFLRN